MKDILKVVTAVNNPKVTMAYVICGCIAFVLHDAMEHGYSAQINMCEQGVSIGLTPTEKAF